MRLTYQQLPLTNVKVPKKVPKAGPHLPREPVVRPAARRAPAVVVRALGSRSEDVREAAGTSALRDMMRGWQGKMSEPFCNEALSHAIPLAAARTQLGALRACMSCLRCSGKSCPGPAGSANTALVPTGRCACERGRVGRSTPAEEDTTRAMRASTWNCNAREGARAHACVNAETRDDRECAPRDEEVARTSWPTEGWASSAWAHHPRRCDITRVGHTSSEERN